MTIHPKTRVALCGIGGYGGTYAMELLRMGPERNTVFAAAVDPYPERCGGLAEIRAKSIPVFASLDEMYEKVVPDLVVVSTPIHLHASQSILFAAPWRGTWTSCATKNAPRWPTTTHGTGFT